LQQAYSESHNWERFGRIISEACYLDAMRRSESFLFQNGEQRYLDLIKNNPQIFSRIPLYHIASYMGLERESLSRLRKKVLQA
jgi:CRP/FNR family transcriptional regulator